MDNLGWLIVAGALVVLLLILVIWFFATRSNLLKQQVQVDEAWHDIAVQLKRRGDLVPSIVQAVRGYADHEQSAFAAMEQARTETLEATTPSEASTAENHFQGALRALYGIADAFPKLTASPEFVHLKADLGQTEDKIQSARRAYNGSVRGLNARVQGCPGKLVAGAAGVRAREFFEVADRAAIAEPPRVQF
ncbi:LemA family protein [Gulosibacter macacae]|uniref:LemA family protein n=1 Tax=Gulosibacter macacae TaxID=2488791 RepID=A0A3P3VVD6_9MICO|nr:LemA family protein [Gulosibacter macacae]RRJ86414.1 LemA family protein [Gulosibacter macacae]